MKCGRAVKFTVYRKVTNKEDYVHFLSAHNERVKSGIVIGFFFRAFRICSEDFLQEELEHIFVTFDRLHYPKGFLLRMKKKAEEIRRRTAEEKRKRKQDEKKRGRYISIPNSTHADSISRQLRSNGSNVTTVSGRKVEYLTRTKPEIKESDSVVYKIPCSGPCNKSYIGETGRGLNTRLKEHKRDVRNHNRSNAIVLHIEKCQNLPDWNSAHVIEKGMSKSVRKALEAAHMYMLPRYSKRKAGILYLG